MTAFQQFRLWLRDGPAAERVGVGLVAVLAALLLAWATIPVDSGSRSASAAGEASPTGAPASAGAATQPAAGGPSTTVAAASAAGGTTPSGAPSTGPASAGAAPAVAAQPACPRAADQGVDDKQVRIAVVLPNIQGQAGNALVGLPSYDDQVKFFQAAIAEQNRRGGAGCRQIVASYYDANPLDAAGAQQRCLDIAAAKPFAVIDSVMGYIAGAANCLPQHQLPTFQTSYLLPSQIKDYYPYSFSVGRWDSLLHDWAQALKQMGWFDPAKGFKKLGVLVDDCFPEVSTLLFGELAKVGIEKSNVEVYDFGGSTCAGIPPANQYQQAVLSFERAGVTHVADVVAPTVQSNYFSRTAGAQRAKFSYTTPDHGAITTFESAGFSPDPQNYDGAIAITQTQYGALKSGVGVSQATNRCNVAMAAAGMPSVQDSGVNFAGSACNFTWLVSNAIAHAPTLRRTEVVTGLDKVGSMETSYPWAPVNFNRVGLTTGGHFWRAARYDGGCSCFKLLSPDFKPNFP